MAACNLGYLYETGVGVEQNWKEAAAWYEKSAEQSYPRAQYNLAWCYENGKGVEQNIEKALELYRAAAETGFDGADKAIVRLEKEKKGFFKGLFGGKKNP